MLRALLDGRRERQHLVGGDSVAGLGDCIGDHEAADRERAGLVEHDRVHAIEQLERGRVLDQDPELGAAARGDHDRRRRRQPHGAGARDHENGHRAGERVEHRRRGAEGPPREERQRGDPEHDRDEDRGNPIGEPLDGRARALRVRDELDDPRQRGLAAHARGPKDEASGPVDGARQNL